MAHLIAQRTSSRVPAVLAALAVLAQIVYPLTAGTLRDHVTIVVVMTLALAGVAHAATTYGAAWALRFVAITAGIGLAVEILGIATGFPFGSYEYGDRLGPAVAGVPLVIAVAWTAGVYPVWAVARLCHRGRVARIVATAVATAGWDLYLDPQMVADGQWTWHSTAPALPGLPDIPITNYLAWLVVALVMAVLSTAGDPRGPDTLDRSGVPIVLFLWTWLGSALAHAVFLDAPQLRWSALYGLIGMGTLGIPLVTRLLRSRLHVTDR